MHRSILHAYIRRVHYLQKISDKKGSENITVRNFYSTVQNLEVTPKLLVSFTPGFMERTLVETLLDIRNGLIEFALFSRRCIRKTLRVP